MDWTEAMVFIVLIVAITKCGDNRCEQKEPCNKIVYKNNEYRLCEGDTLSLENGNIKLYIDEEIKD